MIVEKAISSEKSRFQTLTIKDRRENLIYKTMSDELNSQLINEQLVKAKDFKTHYFTECHGYETKTEKS